MRAIAMLGLALFLSAASPGATRVVLRKDTPIVVQTYNSVNSATFHSGERMAYLVSDDVIVNGTIIAKAGDAAIGTIEDAQQGHQRHAGSVIGRIVAGPIGAVAGRGAGKAASKGANLRVSVTSMQTFCGASVPLAFVRSEYRKPKGLKRTNEVNIAKGQKYVTKVAADTTVCGTPTTRTPAPIPQDALPADANP